MKKDHNYHYKIIISNFIFGLTSRFILWMPSLTVRRLYLRFFLKKLGKKVYISRNVTLLAPYLISIGDGCIINENVVLDGRGGLTIGRNVDIARDSAIWTAEHDYNDDYHVMINKSVIIEDYVWIASRATILPGKHLYRGCVVGSNAVVTKDVPDMAVVAGNPAKVLTKRKSNLLYNFNYHPRFYI